MSEMKKLFAFLLLAAFFAAGCLSESGTSTPSPSPLATSTPLPTIAPTATPTAVPSASPTVAVEIPSATPEETNYSQVQVVSAYFDAVGAKDYAKAYALVSRDFKLEDPDAASLEAFTLRVQGDFPKGVFSVNERLAKDNREHVEVLADVTEGGESYSRKLSYILVFESGFWKLRVPFNTPGLYYNEKTAFVYNSHELSRSFELLLNDYFGKHDRTLEKNPLEFQLFDTVNYIRVITGKFDLRDEQAQITRESDLDITFGPYPFLGTYSTSSLLPNSTRKYYFEFPGSAFTGGKGALLCYYGKSRQYLFSFVMDDQMALVYSQNASNPFEPLFAELSKGCPA